MAIGNLRRKSRAAASLYETDFHRWTEEQASALREGRSPDIDWENVAEEIESLGRNDKRALESHLETLLAHLLKCVVQPQRKTRSWTLTIREQRSQIAKLIERNPSLGDIPEKRLDRAFGDAVRMAARDTGLDERAFPQACPFALGQILDDDFMP